jgi:hypothetical protein
MKDGHPIPLLELGDILPHGMNVSSRIISRVSGDAEFGKFPVLRVGPGNDDLDHELIIVGRTEGTVC